MGPYNLLIFSVSLLFIIDYALRKNGYGIFGLLAIILTIAFVVFRDYVGYDYAIYVEYFATPYEKLTSKGLELGYICIHILTHELTDNYFWLFFVFGILTIIFISRGISLYTTNFRIGFLIYLLTPGLFINSFSIIRQGLALALLFNSFYYYFYKEYKSFILYVVGSILFHYTALVALPFLLVAPAISKRARALIIIGVPISLIISKIKLIPILISTFLGETKFGVYATFTDQGTSFLKLLILNTVILLYLFWYNRLDRLNRTLLVIVGFGLMLTNICSDVAAITRIGYYFKIFDCVLIPNIIASVKRPYVRLLLIVLVVLYYFSQFTNALIFDSQLDYLPKLTPYRSIF